MVRTNYSPHLLRRLRGAHDRRRRCATRPVFTVHRILTPDEAEGILEQHEADGITLVRALIADPEWVNKAREGRDDEIRRCTGINQSCYGNLLQSMPINCVQNPAVGREDELGARHARARRHGQAASSWSVAVARAGMEAACDGGGARPRRHAPRARSPSSAARLRWAAAAARTRGDLGDRPTGGSASASAGASTCGSASTRLPTRVLALVAGRGDHRDRRPRDEARAGPRTTRCRCPGPSRTGSSTTSTRCSVALGRPERARRRGSCCSTRSATRRRSASASCSRPAAQGRDVRHARCRSRWRSTARPRPRSSPRGAGGHGLAPEHRDGVHRRPRGDGRRRAVTRDRDDHRPSTPW